MHIWVESQGVAGCIHWIECFEWMRWNIPQIEDGVFPVWLAIQFVIHQWYNDRYGLFSEIWLWTMWSKTNIMGKHNFKILWITNMTVKLYASRAGNIEASLIEYHFGTLWWYLRLFLNHQRDFVTSVLIAWPKHIWLTSIGKRMQGRSGLVWISVI